MYESVEWYKHSILLSYKKDEIPSVLPKDSFTDKIIESDELRGSNDPSKFDTSVVQVHRIRDFKINGIVGDKDQKHTLSYTSLSFQMDQGRKAACSPGEIQAAVIRAIRPGSNVRNYLESKVNISHEAFIKVLRSHFKEKDATMYTY